MKLIKFFLPFSALLLLNACSSELQKAGQLYQQSNNIHLEAGSALSDPLGEAIELLEGYLSRNHDEPRATLLLWRCYLKAGHPRAQAMYDNMKQMPEAICKVFASAIRREPDEQMRERMVYLLGELATADEVVPLLQILEQDRSAVVQSAAADVVAKLGAAKAIPSLLHKLGTAQPELRDYACRALSAFPTSEVVEALLYRLRDLDEAPEVRHQAAHSLGRMRHSEFDGKAKLHQQLDALLQDQSQPITTRLLAAYALAALGRETGYALAMANANNGDAYLRGLAIITLGYIGNYQALPYLTEALQYGNKALRLQAAEALGRLGDAKALPSLYKALDDPSDAVREAANQSINKIKAQSASG